MFPTRDGRRRSGALLSLLLALCLADVLTVAPPAAADTIGSVTGFSATGTIQTLWRAAPTSSSTAPAFAWGSGRASTWIRQSDRSITVPDERCLTTLNAGTANGTALTLVTCDGTDPRRWTLT